MNSVELLWQKVNNLPPKPTFPNEEWGQALKAVLLEEEEPEVPYSIYARSTFFRAAKEYAVTTFDSESKSLQKPILIPPSMLSYQKVSVTYI